MSSPSESVIKEKKRRLRGSCSVCRRRKIRCDSSQMPNNICSHCIEYNLECLHPDPPKKPGPKKRYVEDLEKKVNELENAMRQREGSSPSSSTSTDDARSNTRKLSQFLSTEETEVDLSDVKSPDETVDQHELVEHLKKLNISSLNYRFFGASSTFMLVKDAMSVKNGFIGRGQVSMTRRPEFWHLYPWELALQKQETPRYTFPDPDLMFSLFDVYFERVHPFLPMFHCPTFLKDIKDGLHLRDYQFGGVVLMVCAVASTFSQDPRVFSSSGHANVEHSSGYKFYSQVQMLRKVLFESPTVFDVQIYALMAIYYLTTSMPQGSFTVMGLGFRFCEELGMHRRKLDGLPHTIEEEVKRRVFYSLLSLDIMTCSFIGRSCYMDQEEYDIDYPMECDDEYFQNEDPTLAFVQPAHKPAYAAYFTRYVKIIEILGLALRGLYGSKKSKTALGVVDEEAEHRLVANLDSMLNEWIDSVPPHLRWGADQPDPIFRQQSHLLYCTYHHVQIQVHRPFIFKRSAISLPSLAICVHAARSLTRVLDTCDGACLPVPIVQGALNAGVILLLNVWGQRRLNPNIDVSKDLMDIQKCKEFVRYQEKRWQVAGRMWDLLDDLSSMDLAPEVGMDAPLPPVFSGPTSVTLSGAGGTPGDWEDAVGMRVSYPVVDSVPPPQASQEPPAFQCSFPGLEDVSMGWTIPDPESMATMYNIDEYFPQTQTTGATGVDDNLFNILLDAPGSFNIDEWSSFMLNTRSAMPNMQAQR